MTAMQAYSLSEREQVDFPARTSDGSAAHFVSSLEKQIGKDELAVEFGEYSQALRRRSILL